MHQTVSVVNKMATTHAQPVQPVQVCGVCLSQSHPTDACPSLQDDIVEQANALNNFGGQPQRRYDPFSSTYNPGWKDHPNLRYGNQFQNQRPQQNQYRPLPQHSEEKGNSQSLEDLVRSLALTTQQHIMKSESEMQELKNQVSHLASTVNELKN